MARSLLVKITCAGEAAERANQGLTIAATAAASGVPVSLWLAGEATGFALREDPVDLGLPLATPVAELMATVIGLGQVTLCGRQLVAGQQPGDHHPGRARQGKEHGAPQQPPRPVAGGSAPDAAAKGHQ